MVFQVIHGIIADLDMTKFFQFILKFEQVFVTNSVKQETDRLQE